MFGSESLLNIDLDALPVRAGIEPRRAGEGTGALSELRLPKPSDFVRMAAGRAGDEQACDEKLSDGASTECSARTLTSTRSLTLCDALTTDGSSATAARVIATGAFSGSCARLRLRSAAAAAALSSRSAAGFSLLPMNPINPPSTLRRSRLLSLTSAAALAPTANVVVRLGALASPPGPMTIASHETTCRRRARGTVVLWPGCGAVAAAVVARGPDRCRRPSTSPTAACAARG